MSGFSVDIGAIDQFIASLRKSDAQLQAAMKALSDNSGSVLGTAKLNDAADSFQGTWKFGVERIGSAIKESTEVLTRVREQYEQADGQMADAMNQMGQAIT